MNASVIRYFRLGVAVGMGLVVLVCILSSLWPNDTELQGLPTKPRPTNTPVPTVRPTKRPTSTPVPPIPTPTVLISIQLPTVLKQNTVEPITTPTTCACHEDIYNCTDFESQAAAQVCYDYCVSCGAGDVHRLDRDSDGVACESLP